MAFSTEICAQNSMNLSRLVIGAPHGRCGKTTLTLGLLRALSRQGITVQPFKKGPDYIDAGWHTAAAGRLCRNLDSFFMEPETIRGSILKASQNSRLSIIEGAMGLFDGLDMRGSSSTAEIAKISKSPVILVLDATRMTRSAAAIVMGCQHFDPELEIAGVVLNKVARPRHVKVAQEAIESFCGIPVIGAIPKDMTMMIPDRHLGLVTNDEINEQMAILDKIADVVSEYVDLKKVLYFADQAEDFSATSLGTVLQGSSANVSQETQNVSILVSNKQMEKPAEDGICTIGAGVMPSGINPVAKFGILKDKAFSFYYPENLEALQNQGLELVEINAFTDAHLPKGLDGLYIGGGFPEIFAEELEKNQSLRSEIRQLSEDGLPVYAECGGLMYLGRSIRCDARSYEMVGVLPFDVQMEKKPQGHGYTILRSTGESPWFTEGETVKGHEFHNSRVVNLSPLVRFAFKVERGNGIEGQHDGISYKRILAAYNHVHALGSPRWAEEFARLINEYRIAKCSIIRRAAGE